VANIGWLRIRAPSNYGATRQRVRSVAASVLIMLSLAPYAIADNVFQDSGQRSDRAIRTATGRDAGATPDDEHPGKMPIGHYHPYLDPGTAEHR